MENGKRKMKNENITATLISVFTFQFSTVIMKHLGNFVALLILAVNALFTGLLLFTAYSPHIQPVTHPVQSCLGLTFPVFLMINAGFLIFGWSSSAIGRLCCP